MRSTPKQGCSFVLNGDRQAVEPSKPVRQARAGQLPRELNLHLPPHLREVCTILAAGLLRLRAHTGEDLARDVEQGRGLGESSLHFSAEQSGRVLPQTRRHA